jgi:hypothetical protein
MKKIIISAMLFVLITTVLLIDTKNDVKANGRRTFFSQPTNSNCYPTYSAPTYYEPTYVYRDVVREVPVAYPVPFTVAVPVVSYLYNGGGYGYAPVYQAQPAPGMGTVSNMPQPPQQVQSADPTQLTDAQVDNLLTRIEQRLAARQKNGTNGTNGTNGKVTTPPPPTAVPSDVYTILTLKRGNDQKSCADCHTGSGAKGSMKIFLEPSKLNPDVDWTAIWDAADTGTMPPETKKNRNAALSDQEVNVLRQKMMESNKHSKK